MNSVARDSHHSRLCSVPTTVDRRLQEVIPENEEGMKCDVVRDMQWK